MPDVKRSYRGVSADERHRQRRRLLLEACLDLVGSGGTRAVTAESVSAHAKLTKRYFYENFTGRDAILVAALDEMFVELITNVRNAIDDSDDDVRSEVITQVFVSSMCDDPRRARLYAESQATPALHARREDAIAAFTDLLTDSDAQRRLMTRIIVSGVTDVVTNWINGTLPIDRQALVSAIATLGRAIQA